jgi:hypothetical protein
VILFEPLDKQDTMSGAPIEKGSYNIARAQGLKPGKYRVRVTAGDGITPAKLGVKKEGDEAEAAGPGGSTNIISKELIPASWNVASLQEVTIDSSGSNQKNFNIPDK